MFLPSSITEYICTQDLDLYNSPTCRELATQVAQGRQLKIITSSEKALEVQLCEDGYLAWLPREKLTSLEPAKTPYSGISLSREQIVSRLDGVIDFTQAAQKIPNYYLWGGTLGPNYDCSGLIQKAFSVSGIWLPRDSYQQEAFTQSVTCEELLRGDLIFFGQEKVNHVALYLGEGWYIHSSGREMGRNGIGIDQLSLEGDTISQAYYQKLWGFGRVMASYIKSA